MGFFRLSHATLSIVEFTLDLLRQPLSYEIFFYVYFQKNVDQRTGRKGKEVNPIKSLPAHGRP